MFNTIAHFKTTDRNAFIPLSCYHDSWLKSVPRSQFIRMRRNRTELSDYKVQAQILKGRLVEKGYVAETLEDVIEQVGMIERSSLLEEKNRGADNDKIFSVPFITTFSTQHYLIKNIIRKHWY